MYIPEPLSLTESDIHVTGMLCMYVIVFAGGYGGGVPAAGASASSAASCGDPCNGGQGDATTTHTAGSLTHYTAFIWFL